MLCASRAAWWPWTVPREDRDPCVPSTHCPWHKHLPRCGGPLNLRFLLSLPLWLPLSLGWGSGVPGDVAWEGFHSHRPVLQAVCLGLSPLFSPHFSPIPLLVGKSLSHICSGRAEEAQPCRSDPRLWTLCPFTQSMILPGGKSLRKALSIPLHPLMLRLCSPKHPCWAEWEDWSSSGLRAGGRNAPGAAPS